MIALEPDFEQVLELAVAGDVGSGQVGVIVQNRLASRMLVIQTPGCLRVQQEVIVDEIQVQAPEVRKAFNREGAKVSRRSRKENNAAVTHCNFR